METQEQPVLTEEEKLLGLFSHASLVLGGIVVPIIFWIIYRNKSKFVVFHSVQALFFHVAYVFLIIIMVLVIVVGALGFGSLFALNAPHRSEPPVLFIILMVAMYAFIILTSLSVVLYSMYMAYKAYKGSYNKYPIIGKLIYNHVYHV